MSNETVCYDYSDEFGKKFRDVIPVSDLADLLLYVVYLKQIKNIELEGFEYLLAYQEEGIEEVDQFAFTNTFLYIQNFLNPKLLKILLNCPYMFFHLFLYTIH